MKAYITKHTTQAPNWPRLSNMQAIGALGGHEGDSIDLDFSTGEAHTGDLTEGLYRIGIDGGNARVRIEVNAFSDQTGEFWFDGDKDLRFVREGQRISVIADAG